MPNENHRSDRVAAMMREEIASFLASGAKDPRIVGLVTVTGVDVSRDLRHAKVFVTVMGSAAERAETFAGLESIATHLRAMLGKRLRLRLAPEVSFRPDESLEYAARIETLLEALKRGAEPPA
jgi:ribosome-binding factor A